MKKSLGVLAALCLAALAFWALFDAETPDSSARPESLATPSADEALPAPPAPELRNAVLSKELPARRGARTLKGKVVLNGEPVAAATVTATRGDGTETLSELGCHCDNECGFKLLQCGCPEASDQLRTLVTERRGEVVPLARAQTGSDGTFELTGLDDGRVALWADSPTHGTALKRDVEVETAQPTLELGSGVVLQGKVLLDGKSPVAAAWVTAINVEESRFFDGVSEADGTFKLGPLPRGRYSMVAGAAGVLTGHLHLKDEAADTSALELEVYTPKVLEGTVLSSDEPVAGAKVELEGNHKKRDTVSGPDGQFRFGALRPGTYQLKAWHQGQLATGKGEAPKLEPSKPVQLLLAEEQVVEGVVKDPEGKPVAKAEVSTFGKGSSFTEVKTGPDGTFRLSFAGAAPSMIDVNAKGFQSLNQPLEPGRKGPLQLTLQRSSPLSGVVVDREGQPIDGVRLLARPEGEKDSYPSTAYTADGGHFAFTGLSPGTFSITAAHSDYARATAKWISPSENNQLTLTDGLTLEGEVVDQSGKPVVATVWSREKRKVRDDLDPEDYYLEAATARESHQDETDEDGHFVLRGLQPGEVTVTAKRAKPAASGEQDYTVKPTGTNHVRIVVDAMFTISGTVLDAEGAPVKSAWVMAEGQGKAGGSGRVSQGKFEVKELSKGEYSLVARSLETRLRSKPVKAQSGATQVILRMPRATTLSGRLLLAPKKPAPEFTLNGQPFESGDGTFSLTLGEEAADARLVFGVEGRLPLEKTFKVQGGRDNPVGDLILPQGRDVTLRFVSKATQKPVSEVGVWRAADFNGHRRPLATSNAAGELKLQVTDDLQLIANHDIYRPTEPFSVPPGETQRRLELEAGATLDVRVTDANGSPTRAALAAVELGPLRPGPLGATQPDGTAKWQGMPGGKWAVRAMTKQGAVLDIADLPENETRAVALSIPSRGAAVTLELSGAPASAYAALISTQLPKVTAENASVLSSLAEANAFLDASGKGTFQNVQPGAWQLFMLFFDPEAMAHPGSKMKAAVQTLQVQGSGAQKIQVPLGPIFELDASSSMAPF